MHDAADQSADEIARALAGVAKLYGDNLREFGEGARSVGWKDGSSHLLRFAKLAQVIDASTAGDGISVNDFGCGYGALFRFLDAMPGCRLERYVGYDISDEMLQAAKESLPAERVRLMKSATVEETADYTFVSGTFNVKLESSDEAWRDYIERTLLHLAGKSRCGLAFNLLSTYVDWRADNLYYADPLRFFDFCKRRISRHVSLLHDYPLYEWTILVRMDPAA